MCNKTLATLLSASFGNSKSHDIHDNFNFSSKSTFGKTVDVDTNVELCGAQKVRQPKVEKYSAKQLSNGTFLFEKKSDTSSKSGFVIGGKDSCQVRPEFSFVCSCRPGFEPRPVVIECFFYDRVTPGDRCGRTWARRRRRDARFSSASSAAAAVAPT